MDKIPKSKIQRKIDLNIELYASKIPSKLKKILLNLQFSYIWISEEYVLGGIGYEEFKINNQKYKTYIKELADMCKIEENVGKVERFYVSFIEFKNGKIRCPKNENTIEKNIIKLQNAGMILNLA